MFVNVKSQICHKYFRPCLSRSLASDLFSVIYMNYCSFSSELFSVIYLALDLKWFKKDQYCEIALENVNHANFFHSFSYSRKPPTYTDQPIRVVIWLYSFVNSFACKYSDNY